MLYFRSRTYNRQRPFVSRFLKRSQQDSDSDENDNSQVNSAAAGENNQLRRRATAAATATASDQTAADNDTGASSAISIDGFPNLFITSQKKG